MKLSENISFVHKLGVNPSKTLLEDWQSMAKGLESRAENLDDKLRATKAELEACRAAVKGKNEHIQGLNGQLRERDRLIDALKQEGEYLRRSISENANTVALNKHIANLTSESQRRLDENRRLEATIKDLKRVLTESEMRASLAGQQAKDTAADRDRQKNTIRQLEDQNKNLEAALVKAEGQVRCLQGVVDTQTKLFHAVPTPGHDLSVRLERQRRTIDDYRAEVDKLLRQLNELTGQRDRLATELRDVRKALAAKTLDCNDAANKLAESRAGRNADVVRLSDQRNHLRGEVEKLTRRNDNQSGFVREYQEEVCKLREQLETERTKVGPVQDIYKDSKLEVRLLNEGGVEVLEYPANLAASPRRLRKTHILVDWRTKVAHREVSIDDIDLKKGQVLGTITEYGPGRTPLSVFTGVPINGLLVTTGA